MSFGMAAAWRTWQKKTRPCPRCGLRYPEVLERCPHCAELDERGLQELRERVAREHEGHVVLGRIFLAVALLILAVLLMIFMG